MATGPPNYATRNMKLWWALLLLLWCSPRVDAQDEANADGMRLILWNVLGSVLILNVLLLILLLYLCCKVTVVQVKQFTTEDAAA